MIIRYCSIVSLGGIDLIAQSNIKQQNSRRKAMMLTKNSFALLDIVYYLHSVRSIVPIAVCICASPNSHRCNEPPGEILMLVEETPG